MLGISNIAHLLTVLVGERNGTCKIRAPQPEVLDDGRTTLEGLPLRSGLEV